MTERKEGESFVIHGTRRKLHNRRVWLGKDIDGSYYVVTKSLDMTNPKGERVFETKTRWSEEGLATLCQLFMNKLASEIPKR